MRVKNSSLKSKKIRGEKESTFVKKKKKVTAENDHSQNIIIVQSINFSTQEGLKGRYTAIAKAAGAREPTSKMASSLTLHFWFLGAP